MSFDFGGESAIEVPTPRIVYEVLCRSCLGAASCRCPDHLRGRAGARTTCFPTRARDDTSRQTRGDRIRQVQVLSERYKILECPVGRRLDHGESNGIETTEPCRQVRCFIASLRVSLGRELPFAVMKRRTSSGSVFAYSRRAQPIAFCTKNS